MADQTRKKTQTTGISAAALAKAAEQALEQALKRACEILRDPDLKATEITALLKTLDSIRFSLRWQDKVLRRAEQHATALLSKSFHPKATKEVGDRLKSAETRLKDFGRSTALTEFDRNIGIKPGEDGDAGAEEEVA